MHDMAGLIEFDNKEAGRTDNSDENLTAIKSVADFIITNDGSLDELYEKLDRVALIMTAE